MCVCGLACLAEGNALSEHVQQRALSRSRGPHDGHHLRRLDRERQGVDQRLRLFLLTDRNTWGGRDRGREGGTAEREGDREG